MAIATLIPVYQYHSETPVWCYFYTTDSDIEEGWIRDGIAFYAFAAPSAELVKVSRYYASDKNPWIQRLYLVGHN